MAQSLVSSLVWILAIYALGCGESASAKEGAAAADGAVEDESSEGADAAPAAETYECTRTLSPGGDIGAFVDGLDSGDVGCLEAGTYRADSIRMETPGVTLASVPGERARIELDYLYILRDATEAKLLRLDLVTEDLHLIRIFADGAVLERNLLSNSHAEGAGACVGVGGSEGTPSDVILRGNHFVDCGGNGTNLNHAIYANKYRDLLIEDNIFRGTGGYSIQLYPDAIGTIVRHNVIDGSKEYSVRGGLVIDGTSENHIIEHNVFAYAESAAIIARVGSGHVARSNCFWDNDGGNVSGDNITVEGNVEGDPRFADRAQGDLRLGGGSPCLDVVEYDTAAKLEAIW